VFLKVNCRKRSTPRSLNERETGVISRRFEVAALYANRNQAMVGARILLRENLRHEGNRKTIAQGMPG
jgi:hypothetical protein